MVALAGLALHREGLVVGGARGPSRRTGSCGSLRMPWCAVGGAGSGSVLGALAKVSSETRGGAESGETTHSSCARWRGAPPFWRAVAKSGGSRPAGRCRRVPEHRADRRLAAQ